MKFLEAPLVSKLLSEMLKIDPKQRPTMKQVMKGFKEI